MDTKDKIELLKIKREELINFTNILNKDNLSEFKKLKKEISALLIDSQRIKFNGLNFFQKISNYSKDDNELPF